MAGGIVDMFLFATDIELVVFIELEGERHIQESMILVILTILVSLKYLPVYALILWSL